MNNVVLIGRLTKDPEVSYTPTQKACARFTLAVDRPTRTTEDKTADFINITVWDTQAENCKRYLHKGDQCGIQGRIQTGSYTNREGQKIYTTDVVASRVKFLFTKPKEDRRSENIGFNAMDDDVPY